jgi:hypothetical protein
MRAALRHLCKNGVDALKPQKVVVDAVTSFNNHIAKPAREVWRRPKVSKRVANDLRKAAIKNGTYGSFCSESGKGWNPQWDLVLHQHRYEVTRFGGMRPNKKTSQERSREDRALKLEQNLETRLELIEEYYSEKEASRVQDKSFEARMKAMTRGGGPGGPK